MFCQYLYSGPQESIDAPTLTPWTKEPGTKHKHHVEFLERHFKKLMYIKFASISGVPQAVCYISILMLEKKTAQLYLLFSHHNIDHNKELQWARPAALHNNAGATWGCPNMNSLHSRRMSLSYWGEFKEQKKARGLRVGSPTSGGTKSQG